MKEKPELYGEEKLLKDLILNEEFAEQRETIRRLNGVTKPTTDMSMPETYKRVKILSANRSANANNYAKN